MHRIQNNGNMHILRYILLHGLCLQQTKTRSYNILHTVGDKVRRFYMPLPYQSGSFLLDHSIQ